MMLFKSQSER
ncbi:hypothetical protein R3I93_016834 [Phoxinus phoxinus]|uniref:Uncharacterized protein n=1 Tax=Phoxinus phoxinus TaxID=58324 RepID=A0AAN9CKB5_9TELE